MEQQTYMDLAEYVAGGRPLEISQELISLVKKYGAFRRYSRLYRIWLSVDTDKVLQHAQAGRSFAVQRTHACTRSWKAIKEMYEEEGYEGYPVLVTKYIDIVGFDPMEVLRNGIELASSETSFVKRAIMMHEFQKEICTVQPITKIHKEDIYTVLN